MGKTQAEAEADCRRDQEHFGRRDEIAAVGYDGHSDHTGSGSAHQEIDALEGNRRRRKTLCLTRSTNSRPILIPGQLQPINILKQF